MIDVVTGRRIPNVVINIVTGRRLHFGLFSPTPVPELNLVYGGIGVMVNTQGVALQARRAYARKIHGPMSERVKCIVEMLQQHPDAPAVVNPWEIEIYKAAPLHQGWGTGTQLSLAVARAWCHLAGFSKWNAQEAATWVGRGLRSGIGVAGFDQGGFLIDFGKKPGDFSRSQVQHIDLPKNWTWLLVESKAETGVHGEAERLALAKIGKPDIGIVKELMHLGQNVLPQAARDRSFTTFAETLTHYNRLAGSFYREIQGGDYSSREIEKRIVLLRANGAVGVGQSSWGPGVFALFPDSRSAHAVRVKKLFPNCRIHQDPTRRRGDGELIL